MALGARQQVKIWRLDNVPSLYSWNIAESDVKPQPTNQATVQIYLEIGVLLFYKSISRFVFVPTRLDVTMLHL